MAILLRLSFLSRRPSRLPSSKVVLPPPSTPSRAWPPSTKTGKTLLEAILGCPPTADCVVPTGLPRKKAGRPMSRAKRHRTPYQNLSRNNPKAQTGQNHSQRRQTVFREAFWKALGREQLPQGVELRSPGKVAPSASFRAADAASHGLVPGASRRRTDSTLAGEGVAACASELAEISPTAKTGSSITVGEYLACCHEFLRESASFAETSFREHFGKDAAELMAQWRRENDKDLSAFQRETKLCELKAKLSCQGNKRPPTDRDESPAVEDGEHCLRELLGHTKQRSYGLHVQQLLESFFQIEECYTKEEVLQFVATGAHWAGFLRRARSLCTGEEISRAEAEAAGRFYNKTF